LILSTIIFCSLWYFGIIQINGATFNIVDASVTTYWDYDEEDREPFPIIPSKSRQIYEDGLVGFKPDFEKMLNDYVAGESVIGLSALFQDGKVINSKGTDYNICVYPENLEISKTNIKPFHNRYTLTDKNVFEFEYKVPYYARYRYFQAHSLDLNIEVETNGILSKSFLDYKLKETYLYYLLDALRQHVQVENQFLTHSFLDTMDNLMFVKDNFEIEKDDFLRLDPEDFASMQWLPSRISMSEYTDDEDCIGVLIATSK